MMKAVQENTLVNQNSIQLTCIPPFLEFATQNLFQMAERPSPPFYHLLCQVMEVPTETSQ